MKKKVLILALLFLQFFSSIGWAHSGRTDSNGGHNCSQSSINNGLCTGYHYHNGGSGTSSGNSSNASNDKDCSDFSSYDEVVQYWNSKGYSATYDPENLDGWGNGVVDDGTPCEAPSGYDKTKINNSPEQIQFKKDQQFYKSGESDGFKNGLKDGYDEAVIQNSASSGSESYQKGYIIGYNKGYEEGKQKIKKDKEIATNSGYSQGQLQDNLVIPKEYSDHKGLMKAFKKGFQKAIKERIKKFKDLGYKDGKKDMKNVPKNVGKKYEDAYQDGYKQGQKVLKRNIFN